MIDHASLAQAVARPGIDPRQWIAIGMVAEDSPDAHSVRFKDDEGNPLSTGPLVTVKLVPSGISVVCRVASFIAGIGEGSWYPFQQRDEVLVALPGGDEGFSPVIIGRLNQELDTWPQVVAGQDMSLNTTGFWRLRTPFIVESAEAFIIRSAKTGSQIGIDSTGQVILNNGDKNQIVISSDVISIASGDGDTAVQVDPVNKTVLLQAGASQFVIDKSATFFLTTGTLNLGTAGFPGVGHAITLEQVLAVISGVLQSLLAPAPYSAAQATAAILAGIPIAKIYALSAPIQGAITTALTAPPDPTGITPGIGKAGFFL